MAPFQTETGMLFRKTVHSSDLSSYNLNKHGKPPASWFSLMTSQWHIFFLRIAIYYLTETTEITGYIVYEDNTSIHHVELKVTS